MLFCGNSKWGGLFEIRPNEASRNFSKCWFFSQKLPPMYLYVALWRRENEILRRSKRRWIAQNLYFYKSLGSKLNGHPLHCLFLVNSYLRNVTQKLDNARHLSSTSINLTHPQYTDILIQAGIFETRILLMIPALATASQQGQKLSEVDPKFWHPIRSDPIPSTNRTPPKPRARNLTFLSKSRRFM